MNIIRFVTGVLSLFIFSLTCLAQDEETYQVTDIFSRIKSFHNAEENAYQLAISTAKGIVVLDSHWSKRVASGFRKAIAKAFGRDDFAYLIDTVDRLDTFGGNEAYRDIPIISHENLTAKYKKETVAAEVDSLIRTYRWREGIARERMKTREPGSVEEERDRRWMNAMSRTADELENDFSLRMPDLAYTDRMNLYLGDVTLELIWLGRAGRDGITIIKIPEERAAIFHNFIMHSAHLAPHLSPDYTQLDVPRWISVYEEILGENNGIDKIITPFETDFPLEKARNRLYYIKTLWDTVTKAEAEGKTLSEVQQICSLDDSFSFVKKFDIYKDRGDEWVREQHLSHVINFYMQHKIMASREIISLVKTATVEKAVTRFKEMLKDKKAFYFDESEFIGLGYDLLSTENIAAAIEVFKMNVAANPDSWNAYDSLGEAYLKNGEKELAIRNYQKSLELNPDNDNAKQMLIKLNEQ